MADINLANQAAPVSTNSGFGRGYFDTTLKRWSSQADDQTITNYPYQVGASSIAGTAAAFAVDTYLSGSSIQIPTAGDWRAQETYRCRFDMTKTAAGVAAFTTIIRMGTAGTIADAAILTLAFGAGTAAIDTGFFELFANFRTVGGGTTAVIAATIRCTHHLAATGLVSTGASGTGIIVGVSAGFASTTQTFIGLSINGGAAFAGTGTIVQAELTR